MTYDECKTILADICADIVRQNRELIADMGRAGFDAAIRLDNTKNDAGYKLTNFFGALKYFPYGTVPTEVTDELVRTTDELLQSIRQHYGHAPNVLRCLLRAGQAFRNSKRIWRIRNPINTLAPADYVQQLDAALCNILTALDNLNFELNLLPTDPTPPPAPNPHLAGDISAKIDKSTARILRAVRGEGDRTFDKRSPQERRLIDRAAIHYTRRHHIDGVDIPLSDCIHHIWDKYGNVGIFRDYTAFANAVRYDLKRYYDQNVLVARAKTTCTE